MCFIFQHEMHLHAPHFLLIARLIDMQGCQSKSQDRSRCYRWFRCRSHEALRSDGLRCRKCNHFVIKQAWIRWNACTPAPNRNFNPKPTYWCVLHVVHCNCSHIYTVNHKKRDILFLTITLANLNRFLYFLYHFNREEILHATVVKFTTSP